MVLKFGGVTLLKGIEFHIDSSHHTFADSTDSIYLWLAQIPQGFAQHGLTCEADHGRAWKLISGWSLKATLQALLSRCRHHRPEAPLRMKKRRMRAQCSGGPHHQHGRSGEAHMAHTSGFAH